MGLFDRIFKRDISFNANHNAEKKSAQFYQTISDAQMRRNSVFEGQRPDSEDYGYSLGNPICTSSVFSSARYLSRLRTSTGEKLYWIRHGAFDLEELHSVEGVIVDVYHLYLHGSFFKELYICPYGHNSSYVPKGLMLANENESDEHDGDVAFEARKMKTTPETVLKFAKFKYESDQLNEKLRQEQLETERKKNEEFQRVLKEKAEIVKRKYPNFDLKTELENEQFLKLVRSKAEMIAVYEYIHKDELFIAVSKEFFNPDCEDTSDLECFYFEYFYSILIEYEKLEEISSLSSLSSIELDRQAKEQGMTVKQFLVWKRLLQEKAEMRNACIKEKIEKWAQQAVALKKTYPNFDLRKEYANDLFRDLMDHSDDMVVAYEIVHFSDLYISRLVD